MPLLELAERFAGTLERAHALFAFRDGRASSLAILPAALAAALGSIVLSILSVFVIIVGGLPNAFFVLALAGVGSNLFLFYRAELFAAWSEGDTAPASPYMGPGYAAAMNAEARSIREAMRARHPSIDDDDDTLLDSERRQEIASCWHGVWQLADRVWSRLPDESVAEHRSIARRAITQADGQQASGFPCAV